MIDESLCSVHLHLYYEEPSIYLMKQLSKVWNGTVYVSIINNGPSNEAILKKSNELFKKTIWLEIENMGTDQYGFFKTHKMNEEKHKPWTLYMHDKDKNKSKWLDELIEVFCKDEYQTLLDNYMRSKKTGIIGSKKCRHKILDYDELLNINKYAGIENRHVFVSSVGTLTWLRELQNIFYNRTSIVKEELLNPYFVAGTVFLIRKKIINQAHSCVKEQFFKNGYRQDGEVEHAMERFYHYVSEALGYNNIFI